MGFLKATHWLVKQHVKTLVEKRILSQTTDTIIESLTAGRGEQGRVLRFRLVFLQELFLQLLVPPPPFSGWERETNHNNFFCFTLYVFQHRKSLFATLTLKKGFCATETGFGSSYVGHPEQRENVSPQNICNKNLKRQSCVFLMEEEGIHSFHQKPSASTQIFPPSTPEGGSVILSLWV